MLENLRNYEQKIGKISAGAEKGHLQFLGL
jgi:hypothetical protein